MPTITEPDDVRQPRLAFTFPNDWYAFRYDEKDLTRPSFYKQRIEKIDGLKGVDIVAGQQPGFPALTLLEIKDYRDRKQELRGKLKSGELQREVLLKAVNTWAALHLGARMQDELLDTNLRATILRPVDRLDFVFFLAEDPIQPSPKVSDTRKEIQNRRNRRLLEEKKLREKLTPLGLDCRLADLGDLPRRCAWEVAALPPQRV